MQHKKLLLGFKGLKPQEIWEFTYSQDSEGQKENTSQNLGMDEEEEMISRDGDYDND